MLYTLNLCIVLYVDYISTKLEENKDCVVLVKRQTDR